MMAARIDKGIEMQMINVLRQLPRKNRISKPVRQPAINPSWITPLIAALTNSD